MPGLLVQAIVRVHASACMCTDQNQRSKLLRGGPLLSGPTVCEDRYPPPPQNYSSNRQRQAAGSLGGGCSKPQAYAVAEVRCVKRQPAFANSENATQKRRCVDRVMCILRVLNSTFSQGFQVMQLRIIVDRAQISLSPNILLKHRQEILFSIFSSYLQNKSFVIQGFLFVVSSNGNG